MCAHAISLFRIRRLIFGAYDPKGGGVDHGARIFDASSCHHRPDIVGGVREAASASIVARLFSGKAAISRHAACLPVQSPRPRPPADRRQYPRHQPGGGHARRPVCRRHHSPSRIPGHPAAAGGCARRAADLHLRSRRPNPPACSGAAEFRPDRRGHHRHYGLLRDFGPAVALPLGVFGLFCSSFVRIYGQAPQQLGALLATVQILSLDRGIPA